MEQLTDIGLSTGILCLGIYFVILIFQYVASKVWIATANKWVRGTIKWVGTMWLPIWPIIIGWFMLHFVDGLPLPEAIKNLVGDHPHSPVLGIYGAFCGMISAAVVKGIKNALKKKGIDVSIHDPAEAKLKAEQKAMDKKIEKIENGKNGKNGEPEEEETEEADEANEEGESEGPDAMDKKIDEEGESEGPDSDD